MNSEREDFGIEEERNEQTFQTQASRDSPIIPQHTPNQNGVQNIANFGHWIPEPLGSVVRRSFWQNMVLRISNMRDNRELTKDACTYLIPFLQHIFDDNEVDPNSRLAMENDVSTEIDILTRHIDELHSLPPSDRTHYWAYEDTQSNEALSMENGMHAQNRLESEVRQVVDALKEVNLRTTCPLVFEISLNGGRLLTRRMKPEELDMDSEEEFGWVHNLRLSEKEMHLLPVKNISQEHVDLQISCSTCMEVFLLDEEVRELPCLHKFHSNCIFPWLRQKTTCPICRVVVDQKS